LTASYLFYILKNELQIARDILNAQSLLSKQFMTSWNGGLLSISLDRHAKKEITLELITRYHHRTCNNDNDYDNVIMMIIITTIIADTIHNLSYNRLQLNPSL